MKVRKILVLSALVAAMTLSVIACTGDDKGSEQTGTQTQTSTSSEKPKEETTVNKTDTSTEEPVETPKQPEFSGVDFSGGNINFLRLDHSRKGTDPAFTVELSDFDGIPAAKISSLGKKLPYIGISVSTLLSESDISKVDTVALKIGIKSLDGEFWPITGSVYAYSGTDLQESSTKVGLQTPDSNPKIVYSKIANPFVAGASNYVLFSPSQDDGTSYVGKNDIYILGIGFRDADGNYLPVNADAQEDFPAGYDATEDEDAGVKYEFELGTGPFESTWLNWNSTDGNIPLSTWQEAIALVVEYAPLEDGTSPIDTNPDAGKFVVQVIGGALEQGWREVALSELDVERVEGKSLKLNLDGMKDVTEVQNIGYGAWDGAETITRIYLVCAGGLPELALGEAPYESTWLAWNSTDGTIPLSIWNGVKKFVVEFAPREDGTSPIDTNPDAGKFVIQVVGGPLEQGWLEIPLNDLNVEIIEGKSVTLTLEGMDQVTEVQNIGYGAWDGADTITRIYVVYSAEPNKIDLGAPPYESTWLNFNSTDGTIPLEAWQQAKSLVVEFAPREDGTSPIDTNPDAGKFVIQVIGGPQELGWYELPLNDLNVEIVEGKSVTLKLEDMDQVTEVQNIGYGAWDGADTITRMYLVTSYSGNQ